MIHSHQTSRVGGLETGGQLVVLGAGVFFLGEENVLELAEVMVFSTVNVLVTLSCSLQNG